MPTQRLLRSLTLVALVVCLLVLISEYSNTIITPSTGQRISLDNEPGISREAQTRSWKLIDERVRRLKEEIKAELRVELLAGATGNLEAASPVSASSVASSPNGGRTHLIDAIKATGNRVGALASREQRAARVERARARLAASPNGGAVVSSSLKGGSVCIIANVGRNPEGGIVTVQLNSKIVVCPAHVDVTNWEGAENSGDWFTVAHVGGRPGQITVRRGDNDGGKWGMDLQFQCCGDSPSTEYVCAYHSIHVVIS